MLGKQDKKGALPNDVRCVTHKPANSRFCAVRRVVVGERHFLAFCLGGRPTIYTIRIPPISLIYSMYIYNYSHVWRAARNCKNPPANNYGASHRPFFTSWCVRCAAQYRHGAVKFFIKIKSFVFWILWSYKCIFLIIEVNIFRGDLSDISAETATPARRSGNEWCYFLSE